MTKYAVIDRHGEATADQTAREAAQIILWHDGQDYEIRKSELGYDLWYRQQVANKGWTKTVVYSISDDESQAEAEIFDKVLWSGWHGYSVMTMSDYDEMVAELGADEARP